MQTVLISGASKGIGLAITQKLIQEGMFVYGLARDFSKTEFKNPNFKSIECDLRNLKEIEFKTKEIKELDVLINNAGVGFFETLDKLKIEQIQEMLETNLMATISLTKLFLNHLKKSEGKILNISSESGLKGEKFGTIYCATKFAIRGFSESLLAELRKDNIQVSCLFPGMVQSSFFEDKSFQPEQKDGAYLTPEDVAETVWQILNLRKGILMPEVVLSPQRKSIIHKK